MVVISFCLFITNIRHKAHQKFDNKHLTKINNENCYKKNGGKNIFKKIMFEMISCLLFRS